MRGISTYKTVSLESSDQRKLVLLCFEALIRRQDAASVAFDEKRYMDAVECLRIAREIYSELLVALDHESAPEMSGQLASLYDFCIRELAMAGQDMKNDRLVNTLRVTHELYEGFKGAFDGEQ